MEGHERYEELALGHVLGGLGLEDAATFRAHLVECRDCRLRVAELRDIAAELAATEREERRRAAIATEVAQSAQPPDEPTRRLGFASRTLRSLTVLLVAALVVTSFWTFHLRRVNREYAEVLERQEEVLAALSAGEAVPLETSTGVLGVAVTLGGQVAISLSGLPAARGRNTIAVWLLRDGEVTHVVGVNPPDGMLPFIHPIGVADVLVVTYERGAPSMEQGPSSHELARVDLSPQREGQEP